MPTRRGLLLSTLALSLAAPRRAHAARTVTDSAGRQITLPDRIGKVFAAGGPAAVALYVLRPDAMIGWPRAVRADERPYLRAEVRDLPEVGLLTGRGDTANIEILLATRPDLVLDFGSVRQTFVSLAESTQARTAIPYVLVDGRFEATPASLRLLGRILGDEARGEALATYAEHVFTRVDRTVAATPEAERPRVYLARGPDGLETGLQGSINTEILERAGGRNVAASGDQRRGIVTVSPEQIVLWNPDIIVTWDRNFFDRVQTNPGPLWGAVQAVVDKRVYLAPTAPFGWIDRPPSLNRLIGLLWLANLFHGDRFPLDLAGETRTFYKLYYQVDVSDADLATLLAWADGRPPAASPRR
jgi:iron complex transport system substrate-binding protein